MNANGRKQWFSLGVSVGFLLLPYCIVVYSSIISKFFSKFLMDPDKTKLVFKTHSLSRAARHTVPQFLSLGCLLSCHLIMFISKLWLTFLHCAFFIFDLVSPAAPHLILIYCCVLLYQNCWLPSNFLSFSHSCLLLISHSHILSSFTVLLSPEICDSTENANL